MYKERINSFLEYIGKKEIILTEENIEKIFKFFDEEKEISFVNEDIKSLYNENKKREVFFSEKARKNIKIFLQQVSNQEKEIIENNRTKLIKSANKVNIIDFGENYQAAEKSKIPLNEVLGKSFQGYKGIAAINKLLEEMGGYVPCAFEREDIGTIDLIWGHYNSGGLSHIIYRRDNQNINIEKFLYELTDVIEKGQLYFNREKKKIEIYKSGKMAIISFMIEKNNLKFLLSSFKRRKQKNNQYFERTPYTQLS